MTNAGPAPDPQGADEPTVTGPCGDLAEVPKHEIRRVETDDGPRVELALLSHAYCWRVRSWWAPDAAVTIADELRRAAVGAPDEPGDQVEALRAALEADDG